MIFYIIHIGYECHCIGDIIISGIYFKIRGNLSYKISCVNWHIIPDSSRTDAINTVCKVHRTPPSVFIFVPEYSEILELLVFVNTPAATDAAIPEKYL